MRELTPACRTMLPAEDGIEAPPPIPAPRGPAPSWVKVDAPGDVTLYFDFDNDFFSLHVNGRTHESREACRRYQGVAGRGDGIQGGNASFQRAGVDRTRGDWLRSRTEGRRYSRRSRSTRRPDHGQCAGTGTAGGRCQRSVESTGRDPRALEPFLISRRGRSSDPLNQIRHFDRFHFRAHSRLTPPLDAAEKGRSRDFVLACSAWVPVTHASVTPFRGLFQTAADRGARRRFSRGCYTEVESALTRPCLRPSSMSRAVRREGRSEAGPR